MKKIKFNRKLVSEENLKQFLDAIKTEGMISGSAVHMLINDMIKLREVCQMLIDIYEDETVDNKKLTKLAQILKAIL